MAPRSKAKGSTPQEVGEDTAMEDVTSHQPTVEEENAPENEQDDADDEGADEEEEETRVKLVSRWLGE
jgi:hypothetical protein